MSLFKKGMQGFEVDDKEDLEELYEKLFMKIGRDFVYREDLNSFFRTLLNLIDPTGLMEKAFFSLQDFEARKKALEYKALIESGKDGSKIYKDLINLDDE